MEKNFYTRLCLTIVATLAASVFAVSPAGVSAVNAVNMVNVGEIPFAPDSVGVKMVDGQPMVSLQGIEDIFKVDANYDPKAGSVSIGMPETTNLTRQLSMLESFLVPRSPRAAAELWLDGVKARNGAVQYTAMSPALRTRTKSDFDKVFWVTGASSPQLGSYKVLKVSTDSSGRSIFDIDLSLDAQGKTIAKDKAVITVEQDPGDSSAWRVSKIVMDDPGVLGITVGVETRGGGDQR